jgi:hypothetical protein
MKPVSMPLRNTLCVIFTCALAASLASAQPSELQQRVAELKEHAAANKQALAQYAWQEQMTISIKGDVKSQKLFLVRMGPDGKPQKTPIGAQQEQSSGRKRGLRARVIENKKEEFEDYAQQIAALAQAYAQPEPGRLQQLFQEGKISLGPAGAPGEVRLVVRDYFKPGDSVTLVLDRMQKTLRAFDISSYLNDPGDVVTLSGQFEQIPGGPSHVSSMLVNGVKKQLTVALQNSNYMRG